MLSHKVSYTSNRAFFSSSSNTNKKTLDIVEQELVLKLK